MPVCDRFQVRLCVVMSEGHGQGWTVSKTIHRDGGEPSFYLSFVPCPSHVCQDGRGGLVPLQG